jgi:hypothetical protein
LFFTLSDSFSVWKKGDEIAARSGILFQSVAAGVAREAVQLPLRACFHAAHPACLQMRSSMTNFLFQTKRPKFIPQPRQRREEQQLWPMAGAMMQRVPRGRHSVTIS